MIVRDRTQPKEDYKGRPTEARDELCPCRSCFHPHDLGSYITIYKNGRQTSEWRSNMRCLTRDRAGCPNELPPPEHVTRQGDRKNCRRCGRRADKVICMEDEWRQRKAAERDAEQ